MLETAPRQLLETIVATCANSAYRTTAHRCGAGRRDFVKTTRGAGGRLPPDMTRTFVWARPADWQRGSTAGGHRPGRRRAGWRRANWPRGRGGPQVIAEAVIRAFATASGTGSDCRYTNARIRASAVVTCLLRCGTWSRRLSSRPGRVRIVDPWSSVARTHRTDLLTLFPKDLFESPSSDLGAVNRGINRRHQEWSRSADRWPALADVDSSTSTRQGAAFVAPSQERGVGKVRRQDLQRRVKVETATVDRRDATYLVPRQQRFRLHGFRELREQNPRRGSVGPARRLPAGEHSGADAFHDGVPLYLELPCRRAGGHPHEPGCVDRSSAGTKPATFETGASAGAAVHQHR